MTGLDLGSGRVRFPLRSADSGNHTVLCRVITSAPIWFRSPQQASQGAFTMRRSIVFILVLLVGCSGAADDTTTTVASGPSTTAGSAVSTLATSTTIASSTMTVIADVVCYSLGSGPDQNDITITITGEPGNSFTGVFAWGSAGAELFDGVFDTLPSQFAYSNEVPGPGRVVVSNNAGERIEVPVRAGVCETVVPDTILEIDVFAFCFEGAEAVVEYTVTASPGIGAGGDVTVFVTAQNGNLIFAETFDGPVAEGSGAFGLGDRSGQITVNAVTSAGVASPISSLAIPDCAQALRIISAEATCISADAWELTLKVEGEPGVAGNYFYSWKGSVDGEVGEFRIDSDGTWEEALFWPGNVDGSVSLASFEDEGFGPVDVVVLACG